MADTEIAAIRALLASSPRPAGLAERRARMDAVFGAVPVPADVRIEAVDAGGVPAEWTATPGADAARVMLYAHGGGYVSGSLVSHRATVAALGRATAARTLAVGYRRPPEHPFPAAADDVLTAYRFLLAQGIAPARIVVAGDSAGGGLTMATLLALRDARMAQPAGGFCISPWVDLTESGDSMASKAAVDPMIQGDYLREIGAQYLAGADPREPRASPLFADLHGLAPLLIQVGSAETLLDDAVRLARAVAAADGRVSLSVWPEMIHVWHLHHTRLAPARAAIAEAGTWMRAAFAAAG